MTSLGAQKPYLQPRSFYSNKFVQGIGGGGDRGGPSDRNNDFRGGGGGDRKRHNNTGEPVTLDGVPVRSIPGLDTLDDETMESLGSGELGSKIFAQ